MEKYKRDAYAPTIEDGDGSLTDSKFGGVPYMEEEWPLCECPYPMEFVIQINLNTLPVTKGDGLLQVWKCPIDCHEGSKNAFIRIINPKEPVKVEVPDFSQYHCLDTDGNRHTLINHFPAKRIVSWNQIDDYPDSNEIEEEVDSNWEYALGGDKLGGWVNWHKEIMYPLCEICEEFMNPLLQLEKDSQIHQWEDGAMYIFQCPNHLNQIAFDWLSYE